MSQKEIEVGRWFPKVLIEAWNRAIKTHNERIKPSPEAQTQIIQADAKQAEGDFVKFLATINAGAAIATLALIGQVKENITKPELLEIAVGVDSYLTAIVLLGFGMIAGLLSHSANWGKFLWSHLLLRLAFFGLNIAAFFKFITGTQAVTDALLAAF